MEGGWVIHLVAALNSQLKWLQVRAVYRGCLGSCRHQAHNPSRCCCLAAPCGSWSVPLECLHTFVPCLPT